MLACVQDPEDSPRLTVSCVPGGHLLCRHVSPAARWGLCHEGSGPAADLRQTTSQRVEMRLMIARNQTPQRRQML